MNSITLRENELKKKVLMKMRLTEEIRRQIKDSVWRVTELI